MTRHPLRPFVLGMWGLGMLAVTAVPAAQTTPVDPAALARSIQRHYDTVRDFSAAFVHAYEGGVLRKTVVERGTVRFKKPGMMRWVYTHPERKEFVSDGVRLYAYVPEDRQVTISPVPAGDGASSPALFLAGQGSLTRDFVASAPAGLPARPPATLSVTLTPRKPESEFEWMTLVVDAVTLQIRGLVTADAQGGRSSFTFDRVRENTGVGDQEFRFTIPRGVDVITNNQTGR
ncbi:MAG: outer membrane lipoprotein carrier protein LolA [Vicinamibacterales bacterium]|nr:outer membrane lipoprotein carrier protein LolA [Vicinamibacterales bacterium]